MRRSESFPIGGHPDRPQVAISAADGKTVAVLTFARPVFFGGSLADGSGGLAGPDRELFRAAFKTNGMDTGYRWYFDGDVDGQDNGQLNRRLAGHGI